MPLGASRITLLAKTSVAVAGDIIRKKISTPGNGNAQLDTALAQFGVSSLILDGTGDYLTVDSFTLDGNFTVEAWVNIPSNPTGNYPIFATDDFMLAIASASGGNYRLQFYDGTNLILANAFTTLNTWHHLAVVRSGSTITAYANGTSIGSNTYSTTSTSAYIGYSGGLGGTTYYTGNIDELRISKSARYTSGFTPSTTPFVNDENTLLLMHFEGTDADVYFEDDNDMARNLTYYSDSYATNTELLIPFDRRFRYQDLSHNVNTNNTNPSTISGLSGNTTSLDTTNVKWPNYGGSISFAQGGIVLKATPNTSFPSAASGTYVVEGWFRATSSVGNNNWALSSADSGGRWLFGINNTTSYSFGTENNIGIGTGWHHIAIVCDGGTKRFYTDGIYKGAWASGNTGFSTLHIGQFNDGDANDFRGNIQDLRVTIGSNRGYTGTNSSSANFTLPDALITSVTAFEVNNQPQMDTANSQFGGSSALFDDVDDYLETIPDIGNFSGDFTIEFWMYTSDTLGEMIACQKYGTAQGWTLVTRSNQRLVWTSTTDGSTASGLVSSNYAYTDNTWTHIAVCHTSSSGLTELFANGSRVGTRTEQNPITVDSAGYFRIGGNIYGVSSGTYSDGPRYFGGAIDELRISDTARYSGSTYTVPTETFQMDGNTLLLMHMDGTDGDDTFPTDFGITVAQGGT